MAFCISGSFQCAHYSYHDVELRQNRKFLFHHITEHVMQITKYIFRQLYIRDHKNCTYATDDVIYL